MTSGDDYPRLARLIDPIDVDAFIHDYWERRPLIVERRKPEYFRDLLSLKDVDTILTTTSLRSSNVRVVRDGNESPSNKPEHDAAPLRVEQVFAQYREGATIVLQFLHERWAPLTELCADLCVELSAGFQVNAYLTPKSSRGLGVHYDAHDVLVLQVEGSKHWRLFEAPINLPLPGQPYRRETVTAAAPLQEFDLNAGDMLYLPRGVVHEATSRDCSSLHLTVGVLPITWAEVILGSVETVIESNAALRQSLPPGFARDQGIRDEAARRLRAIFELVGRELAPDAALSQAAEKARQARRPTLTGHLLDLESEEGIGAATLVQRRPGIQWELSREGESVFLHFHGKKLQMPSRVESELEFIGTAVEPFASSSLTSDLNEEGRLVLVRRLLREGFLTTALS